MPSNAVDRFTRAIDAADKPQPEPEKEAKGDALSRFRRATEGDRPDNKTESFVDRAVRAVGAGLGEAGLQTAKSFSQWTRDLEELWPLGEIRIDSDGITYARQSSIPEEQLEAIEKAREKLPETEGALEDFIKIAAQFGVPFGAWTKGLKTFQSASQLTRMYSAGVISDWTVFDPLEERAGNLAKEHGIPILEYLAAEEDDSWAEGRLKSTIEGLALAGTADAIIRAARLLKGKRQAEKITKNNTTGREVLPKDEETLASVLVPYDARKVARSANLEQGEQVYVPGRAKREKYRIARNDPKSNEIVLRTRRGKEFTAQRNEIIPVKDKNPTAESIGKVLDASVPVGLRGRIFHTTEGATELWDNVMREEVFQGIVRAANQAEAGQIRPAQRMMNEISDLIKVGAIDAEKLPQVVRKYNMSPEELAEMFVKTASFSGRTLRNIQDYSRRLADAFPDNPKVRRKLSALEGKDYVGDRIIHGLRQVEQIRRGMLVTQLYTATRNALTQTARVPLWIADEVLQTTMLNIKNPRNLWHDLAADMNVATGLLRRFDKKSRDQVNRILDAEEHNFHKIRLLQQPVHEVSTPSKIVNLLNVFNRAQEYFFRKAAFEGKLRQRLQKEGYGRLEDLRPNEIPDNILYDAVDHGLEMAFARSPNTNAGRKFVEAWNQFGGTLINPFPRFAVGNALPFAWQHSPLGWIDALKYSRHGSEILKKYGANAYEHSPRMQAKALSRSMMGTMMFGSAWHLRQSEYAGPNWYEIRADALSAIPGIDTETDDVYVDMRPWAPLSTSLFLAEAVMDWIRSRIGGEESKIGIEDFKEAIRVSKEERPEAPPDRVGLGDWFDALAGIQRVPGTGLAIVHAMQSSTPEQGMKIVSDMAGSYAGSFGVPIRQVRDAVAMYSTEEQILRNTRENPLYAPFLNSIPIGSRALPEATNPLRNGIDPDGNVTPIVMDDSTLIINGHEIRGPIVKHFMGLNARHRTRLEEVVQDLGIDPATYSPRTGVEKADRLIAGYTGYVNSRINEPATHDENWSLLPRTTRRMRMRDMLSYAKQVGTEMFTANHPDIAMEVYAKQLDSDVVRHIEQMKGINLRREMERKGRSLPGNGSPNPK